MEVGCGGRFKHTDDKAEARGAGAILSLFDKACYCCVGDKEEPCAICELKAVTIGNETTPDTQAYTDKIRTEALEDAAKACLEATHPIDGAEHAKTIRALKP